MNIIVCKDGVVVSEPIPLLPEDAPDEIQKAVELAFAELDDVLLRHKVLSTDWEIALADSPPLDLVQKEDRAETE